MPIATTKNKPEAFTETQYYFKNILQPQVKRLELFRKFSQRTIDQIHQIDIDLGLPKGSNFWFYNTREQLLTERAEKLKNLAKSVERVQRISYHIWHEANKDMAIAYGAIQCDLETLKQSLA